MQARRALFATFLFAALLSCATAPAPTAKPSEPPPTEAAPLVQLPKDLRPIAYKMSMRIAPEEETYSGSVDIDLELSQARTTIWLHGQGLHVSVARVGDAPAKYEQINDEGLARVELDQPVGPGFTTLHLEFDRAWDTQLVGLYRVRSAGLAYAFTMFEPIDARKAFPCFDEPRFKTPFEISVTVPKDDTAIGNTLSEDEKTEGAWKTIRYHRTQPLPVYLVAWAVGPLDVVDAPPIPPNEFRDHPLPLRGVAAKGRGKELAYALMMSAKLTVWLEHYYGIGFPFEKLDHVAVPDFAWGGEENAGEIHYREEALLFTEGKGSLRQQIRIAGILAHEEAHQWFGDLVTMPWWTDTWLNEGFASFMGPRAVEGVAPEMQDWNASLTAIQRTMSTDSLDSARAVRQPLLRMGDVLSQFDGITYQKGAGVLGMFEKFTGPEKFRGAIHDYLSAHAYGSGDTEDLIAHFSRAAGRDLLPAFHSFLDQPGLPMIAAAPVCDSVGARVQLTQSRYLPLGSKADASRTWQVPVCVRVPEGDRCVLLQDTTGMVALDKCPAWVVPSADATGFYRWSLPAVELAKLSAAPLTVRERNALVSNVEAAVASGALSWTDGFAALRPLLHSSDPSVVDAPLEMLRPAREHLVSEATKPRVDALIRELYRPLAVELTWTPKPKETPETRDLRSTVLTALALDAGDPITAGEAAKRGAAYAKGATFDRPAVSPDLAAVALAAYVRADGVAAFDSLAARLDKLTDAADRVRIIDALAHSIDPALAARARDLAFDPRLHKNERASILGVQFSRDETREATWLWLKARYDELVKAIPANHAEGLPRLAGGFCDEEHLADARAFFLPRTEKMAGGPRVLSQALEQGQLCLAQKKAHGAEAEAFFAAAH